MIGDVSMLLNQKAEIVAKCLRDAGHDPAFQEADAELEDLGYFSPATLGIDATIDGDGVIRTIHIHSQSHHGRRGYDGLLPSGLSFDMSRQAVRRLLGDPAVHGGPVSSPLDLSQLYWDWWQRSGYFLHCEYPDDMSRILMVTITRIRNAEPAGTAEPGDRALVSGRPSSPPGR